MKSIESRLSALEKKIRAKESQKKWRENNREKVNEYARNRYAKKHPERRKTYTSHDEYLFARRERYKENPEKITKQRCNSAANLLFRYGLIEESELKRIKGLCE